MSTHLDTQARKQLLLTRIALERAEWARDVEVLRRRLTVSDVLGGLLHRAGGGGWATALFGHRAEDGAAPAGWAGRVMAIALMVRRHPLWWPLIGGILPWLRSRRHPRPRRRAAGPWLAAGVGLSAALAAWWLSRRTGGTPAPGDRGR